MELKRILAKDSRSASEEAMDKYGRDVLIISSNRVNGLTELIVAVDVATPAQPAPQAREPMAAQREAPLDAIEDDNAFEALLFAQTQAREASSRAHVSPTPAEAPNDHGLTAAQPTPGPAPAPAEHALATQYDSLRGSEVVALLKAELSEIRQEIRVHQQMALMQADALTPSLQPLMDELVERGLPPGLREHMTQAWKHMDDPIAALGLLENELTRLLPPNQAPVMPQGVHVLTGPSGAGKSLACAKLALMASDALGPDAVAWISFADHRAGAWSQTQMLATPSGVATFRAGNTEGLQLLLDELAHMKLILIDTTGVDFERQMQQVRALAREAKVHMVLPMDATLTSIKRALKHKAQLHSVILSKMDESFAPWAMIHGLSQKQMHVSWINDSERLHAPMQVYAPQTLAEKALNTLGQLDEDEDSSPAQTLRLSDMHEVPDLTDTLEPFGEANEDTAPSAASPAHRDGIEALDHRAYGIPRFGRVHAAG